MWRYIPGLVAAALLLPGCDALDTSKRDLTLPPLDSVQAVYARHGIAEGRFAFNGNVLELTMQQRSRDLERGGSLWGRVGPYIYLFTPGTREIFLRWEGVAGVRVITEIAGGREVARALLLRDELEDRLWRRSLNIVGLALQEGTTRPSRLEELVRWGEERTEYQYNPDFVPTNTGS